MGSFVRDLPSASYSAAPEVRRTPALYVGGRLSGSVFQAQQADLVQQCFV
jgi:hypothetical protein